MLNISRSSYFASIWTMRRRRHLLKLLLTSWQRDSLSCCSSDGSASLPRPLVAVGKNRVEIYYDSLNSRFKTTALEKEHLANISSITCRWPKYVIFSVYHNSLSNYKKAKAYGYLFISRGSWKKRRFSSCVFDQNFLRLKGKTLRASHFYVMSKLFWGNHFELLINHLKIVFQTT